MDLLQLMESTRFVGEEFLTWLWFRVERQDGRFTLDDGERIELNFDDQLTLEARLAEAEQNRLKGGSPTESAEAHEALRRGKRVTKAKLRLAKEGHEWFVSIDATTLGLSGLKIPAVLSRETDDKFYERMSLIEEAERMIRELYRLFLLTRLDAEAWNKELTAIRTWVAAPLPGTYT